MTFTMDIIYPKEHLLFLVFGKQVFYTAGVFLSHPPLTGKCHTTQLYTKIQTLLTQNAF